MAAYRIYRAYTAHTPGLIRHHGGRFPVTGGRIETLAGAPEDARTIVVGRADRKAARGFYDSPEYQAAIEPRRGNAELQVVILEGVRPGDEAHPSDASRPGASPVLRATGKSAPRAARAGGGARFPDAVP